MDSFRDYLKDEFSLRQKSNYRYSLRAFAKDLGLSPSTISEILSGRHGIPVSKAEKIANRLGLEGTEQEAFCSLVKKEQSLKRKNASSTHQIDFEVIEEKNNVLLRDWFTLAIYEILKIDGTKTPKKLSELLNIEPQETRVALKTLAQTGLIKKTKTNGTIVSKSLPSFSSELPSRLIRNFHRQIIRKALVAIDNISNRHREFSCNLFPIAPEDLPQIKQDIVQFRRELQKKYSRKRNAKTLFCLNIQFFGLTDIAEDAGL